VLTPRPFCQPIPPGGPPGPQVWGMGEGAKARDAKLDSSATLADTRSALGARWNVVNWPYVEDNYNMATQGTVPVVAST